MVWGGVLAAVVAAGVAAFVTSSRNETPPGQTASTSAPAVPTPAAPAAQGGEAAEQLPIVSRRQTDPGREYYRQGRYDLAIAFWTRAADNGDALAAYQLGVEYMDGKPGVVARDYEKARKYHMQAAEAGDPRAMFDIGSMYEFGFGVTRDLKQAAVWYSHAADYGHAQGAYNLATMLESGEAGRKDEVEAYKYYLIARDNGFTGVPYDNSRLRIDQEAPAPMDLLEKRLTPAQISEATTRAKAFQILSGPLKI
jgi:TPR repeat protein